VFVILIEIVHVVVCLFLVLVVLLQQGKGGGMGGAFGGGAATQVFGGGGAGNILTRATAICAALFMLTSIALARQSSEGDRDLKQRVAEQARKDKDRGTPRKDAPKDKDAAKNGEAPKSGDAPQTGDAPKTAPSSSN
jgi:preprotein translocase subunit SecG